MTAMTPRKEWVVLRCANASTLRLAESLNAAGIEAWSPTEELRLRNRHTRERTTKTRPLMPSFVFASLAHLAELLALKDVLHQHPGFWVWHHFDRIPLIADSALDPLRVEERKAQPADKARQFTRGEFVRHTGAGFEGLPGVVETTAGKFTLVTFNGLQVKIATMLLLPESERKAA